MGNAAGDLSSLPSPVESTEGHELESGSLLVIVENVSRFSCIGDSCSTETKKHREMHG